MLSITKTPLRISFMGGGTDFPEFFNKYSGGVISTTIDKYVYVLINKKFDKSIKLSYSEIENVKNVNQINHILIKEILKKFKIINNLEITSIADIPSLGTGLGSSSAFTISTLKSINQFLGNQDINKKQIAELACNIEIDLSKSPIGIQDQYACSFGGLNHISFANKKVEVKKILLSNNEKLNLENSLILVYTNRTRKSNDILKGHRQNILLKKNINFLKETNDQTAILLENFERGNIDFLAESLNKSWELKKKFNSNVTSKYIDELINYGISNGAIGGKLLGAGKGGFLLFYVPKLNRKKFISSFKSNIILDFKFENQGSKLISF